MSRKESLEATQIHFLAGILEKGYGLIIYPPFRIHHHSASTQGIIRSGKVSSPGEVSLAHNGILFLDGAPAFRKNVLQALREPIDGKKVIITRAQVNVWFPASLEVVTIR